MPYSIQYTSDPDNVKEVLAFLGDQPPCPVCGGYGEYEDNGPKACMPCVSRVVAFIDSTGKRVYADWGDTITCDEKGFHLVRGEEEELPDDEVMDSDLTGDDMSAF
jgi:hypothetical protein